MKLQIQELFIKVNGKMENPMELESYFFKMVLIFMEHFQMGLCMAKVDLYPLPATIFKVELDIIWLKVKE